jgi:hypothetical protein
LSEERDLYHGRPAARSAYASCFFDPVKELLPKSNSEVRMSVFALRDVMRPVGFVYGGTYI